MKKDGREGRNEGRERRDSPGLWQFCFRTGWGFDGQWALRMTSLPPALPPSTLPIRGRGVSSWVIVVALLGIIWLATLYLFFFKAPAALVDKGFESAEKSYSLARKVAKDVIQALQFQPQVTIGSEVVYEQSAPILELATVERRFAQTYSWENKWLGSTKRIELRGTFLAKAGYDMTKRFVVQISPDGKDVRASVPAAQILSMELQSEQILQDDPGLWNSLSVQDREQAKNELLKLARANVEKSNLKTQADAELMKRLRAAAERQSPVQVAVSVSNGAEKR
jgi:hypothetical protein